jgi:hypothetical protein
MTFFNRKEEVLDIELTQHGKYLLSKGKFNPIYYAFFDNDIIYDVSWASGSSGEVQNDAEPRIKEALRTHTQHVFHSVGGDNRSLNESLHDAPQGSPLLARRFALAARNFENNLEIVGNALQQRPEKHFINAAPLGTAQIGNQKAPAWNITFLKGYVSSSFAAATGSVYPTINIPQVNAEVQYETAVGDQFNSPFPPDPFPEEDYHGDDEEDSGYSDGTFIQTKKDFILLDVEELNGLTKNKDFEIEVFKIETVVRTGLPDEEVLHPLLFLDDGLSSAYEITEDDLLVKKESARTIPVDLEVANTNVSYFLGITTDSEIEDRILCTLDPLAKKRGAFSSNFADCDDLEQQERTDIYGPEEQFEDPCE